MKRQSGPLLVEFILCAIFLGAYFFINQMVFAGTFRNHWAVITLFNLGILCVIQMIKNIKKEVKIRPWERWIVDFLIVASVVMLVLVKPNYTYRQGRDIVVAQGYENLYELPVKSIWAAHHFESDGVKLNAYLYAGEKEGAKYYILVNLLDGEIATETVGGGNYIDIFLNMKYGQ